MLPTCYPLESQVLLTYRALLIDRTPITLLINRTLLIDRTTFIIAFAGIIVLLHFLHAVSILIFIVLPDTSPVLIAIIHQNGRVEPVAGSIR